MISNKTNYIAVHASLGAVKRGCIARLFAECSNHVWQIHNGAIPCQKGFVLVMLHHTRMDLAYAGIAYVYNFSGLEAPLRVLKKWSLLACFYWTIASWLSRMAKRVLWVRKVMVQRKIFSLLWKWVRSPSRAMCTRPNRELLSLRMALGAPASLVRSLVIAEARKRTPWSLLKLNRGWKKEQVFWCAHCSWINECLWSHVYTKRRQGETHGKQHRHFKSQHFQWHRWKLRSCM